MSIIRNAGLDDAAAISHIYNHYIANTVVTFEEEVITADQMASRITELQARYPWLVYDLDGTVVGYAYASPWKTRAAYKNTVEVSVYLADAHTGKGLGKLLYIALLSKLKSMNIHTAIGGVAMPNDASVRLHESLGFREVGYFREVGFKLGKWVDVAYWDLLLPTFDAAHPDHTNEATAQHAENYY